MDLTPPRQRGRIIASTGRARLKSEIQRADLGSENDDGQRAVRGKRQ